MDRRLCIRKMLTTPYFFEEFAKSLDDIFPDGWIYDIEGLTETICSVVASYGWKKALKVACDETGIPEVYKYRDSLSDYKCGFLDFDTAEILVALAYDDDGQRITT